MKVGIEGPHEEKVVLEGVPLNRGESICLKVVADNPEAKSDVPLGGRRGEAGSATT